jgi:hypothetical protein
MRLVRITLHLSFVAVSIPFEGLEILGFVIKVFPYVLYVFFWVFPRLKIVICRRFGTLCQFHLQRLGVAY